MAAEPQGHSGRPVRGAAADLRAGHPGGTRGRKIRNTRSGQDGQREEVTCSAIDFTTVAQDRR